MRFYDRVFRTFGATMTFAAAVWAAPAHAEDVAFPLSDGRTIHLPMLGELDCASAQDVLNRIDSTGYRPIGPSAPEDPKDRALYEYEGRVSDIARKCDRGGGMDFRFGIRARSFNSN